MTPHAESPRALHGGEALLERRLLLAQVRYEAFEVDLDRRAEQPPSAAAGGGGRPTISQLDSETAVEHSTHFAVRINVEGFGRCAG